VLAVREELFEIAIEDCVDAPQTVLLQLVLASDLLFQVVEPPVEAGPQLLDRVLAVQKVLVYLAEVESEGGELAYASEESLLVLGLVLFVAGLNAELAQQADIPAGRLQTDPVGRLALVSLLRAEQHSVLHLQQYYLGAGQQSIIKSLLI
jgi:hypothetical protein